MYSLHHAVKVPGEIFVEGPAPEGEMPGHLGLKGYLRRPRAKKGELMCRNRLLKMFLGSCILQRWRCKSNTPNFLLHQFLAN